MTDDTAGETLRDYSNRDKALADRLFRENYEALLKIARSRRRRAQLNTLSTIDLLHESYLKLSDRGHWDSNEHFQRTASLAMRHVIVDHARRRISQKRGGGRQAVPFEEIEEVLPGFSESPEQVVLIADLMDRLGAYRPRWQCIVDARYFAGMTEEETALLYKLSARTVRREWTAAKEWLATQLDDTAR